LVGWRGLLIALMMEAARTSETLVNFYQTTQRYNSEDSHLDKTPFSATNFLSLKIMQVKALNSCWIFLTDQLWNNCQDFYLFTLSCCYAKCVLKTYYDFTLIRTVTFSGIFYIKIFYFHVFFLNLVFNTSPATTF
jgi:hypothetical protein